MKTINLKDTGTMQDESPNLQDDYDLYELASRVHTGKVDMLNRDFTLAWTNKGLEDWSIKQKVLAKDAFDIIEGVDANVASEVQSLLNNEIKDRIVMTRSRDGRVLKALLTKGNNSNGLDEQKMGFFKRMVSDKRKERIESEE